MQDIIKFHRKWYEATKDFPDVARLEIFDAILQYALDGTVKDLTPLSKMVFPLIKQEIDNDNKRIAEISAKRRDAGKQGGAPKNNRNAIRCKEKEQPAEPIPAPTQQLNLFGYVEPVTQKEKPKKPPKPSKHKYAEYVLMTEAEYQKLVAAHGEEGAKWMITKLDNYKAARGTTYKSDYRAILNWVVEEYTRARMKPVVSAPKVIERDDLIRQQEEQDRKRAEDKAKSISYQDWIKLKQTT